jgi:hypothetical protein
LALFIALRSFIRIWMADIALEWQRQAAREKMRLKQTMTQWFGPSPFAAVKAAASSVQRRSSVAA